MSTAVLMFFPCSLERYLVVVRVYAFSGSFFARASTPSRVWLADQGLSWPWVKEGGVRGWDTIMSARCVCFPACSSLTWGGTTCVSSIQRGHGILHVLSISLNRPLITECHGVEYPTKKRRVIPRLRNIVIKCAQLQQCDVFVTTSSL